MSRFPRRDFLIAGSAASATFAIAGPLANSMRAQPKESALGIQLYTVAEPLPPTRPARSKP